MVGSRIEFVIQPPTRQQPRTPGLKGLQLLLRVPT
jgi:hypothetical protein